MHGWVCTGTSPTLETAHVTEILRLADIRVTFFLFVFFLHFFQEKKVPEVPQADLNKIPLAVKK